MAGGKAAILAVKVLGDSRSATDAMYDVALSTQKADDVVKGANKSMMATYSATAAAMALCVRQATALEQATSAVSQVFGEMAPQVMEWAEGMSAYGLSTAEAAQAAAVLGGALKNAGIEMEYVALLSTKLIEISMDLVATFGYSVPQALSAMAAALRAEFDPLEKFGIYLTADMVAAEALRLEMEGVTFESERQAKMIATLSLIYQQSIPYMDAAENMQANMALTTQRLIAETKNLAAAIGTALIPVLQPLVDAVGKAVGALADQVAESEILAAITEVLTGLFEALEPVLTALVIPALEALEAVLDKISGFIERYVMPIIDGLTVAFDKLAQAIDKVVGWVQKAIDAFESFIDTVHEAIDTLTFWNDTYQESVPTSAASELPTPEAAGYGTKGKKQRAPQLVTINVNAPATDPYALARLLTRQLEDYAHIQGRIPGKPLAGAW